MGHLYEAKCNNCSYEEEFSLGFGEYSYCEVILYYCGSCKKLKTTDYNKASGYGVNCNLCDEKMQKIGSDLIQFKRPLKCKCGGYFSINWIGLWD